MFLLPDINMKLRPKLLDLKAGTGILHGTEVATEDGAKENGDGSLL
jgi:hypothetical protein